MEYEPLGNRVLLLIPPREEKTKGGIILPEGKKIKKKRENIGKVVKIGPEVKQELSKLVPVGTEVLFNDAGGEVIKEGKDRFHLVEADDLFAIVTR